MDFAALSPYMKPIDVSSHPEFDDHEAVYEVNDPAGLHALIAIHRFFFHPYLNRPSTLGGTRIGDKDDYPTLNDAITDVLRLSGKGMTKKAALTGIDFGGAKAVIITKPGKRGAPPDKRMRKILEAYSRYLNLLNGAYITAEDMNFPEEYLTFMRDHTKWVAGASTSAGGSGNPSPFTAYGVFVGIQHCLLKRFGTTDVARFRFAIQGVGGVGLATAVLLKKAGGRLFIADKEEGQISRAKKILGEISVIPPERIHKEAADVFVPCAKGAILNERTIAELICGIVAGGANNQLATEEDGYRLYRRGIRYGVDYVMNAGGLISVASEFDPSGHSDKETEKTIANVIPRNLSKIFSESEQKRQPENIVADAIAKKIISGKTSGRKLWQKST